MVRRHTTECELYAFVQGSHPTKVIVRTALPPATRSSPRTPPNWTFVDDQDGD